MEFIAFTDKDDNNIITQDDVLQENHYYPFGMNMEGNWMPIIGTPNDYQYNGKELNQEFGLDLYAYGFRMYDAKLGRFTGVDPLSDQFPWVNTYNYVENSPISYVDLWGLQKISIHAESFAPFNRFGGPYNGDGADRQFGTDPTASSRISGRIDIDASSAGIVRLDDDAEGSTSHNVLTGSTTYSEAEIISSIIQDNTDSEIPAGELNFHLFGNNDLIPNSPDIDVKGNIGIARIDLGENGSVIGIFGAITGDKFPASETFVSDQNGTGVFLGVSGAKGTPLSLIGNNNRPMSSFALGITFDSNGNMTGVIYNNQNYSIEEWNSQFQSLNPQDGAVSTNKN